MASSILAHIVPFLSRKFFANVTYTANRGLHKGMRVHGGLGWVPGGSLSEEDQYLRSLDLAGKVVFDVGGFFGYKTIFFARHAAHVVVYEPNPHNRAKLERNVAENKLQNVTVRPVGLGATPGIATASWDENEPGRTSAASEKRGCNTFDFEVTTLDAEVSVYEVPDFIKIDVEGFEVNVLEGARQTLRAHQPQLLIEMHGANRQANIVLCNEAIRILTEAGYTGLVDVERGHALGRTTHEPLSHIATTHVARMRATAATS